MSPRGIFLDSKGKEESMNQQEAERARREGKFVTAQEGRQVFMGSLVGQNGHVFTLRSAGGRRISNLVAEKISATSRNY